MSPAALLSPKLAFPFLSRWNSAILIFSEPDLYSSALLDTVQTSVVHLSSVTSPYWPVFLELSMESKFPLMMNNTRGRYVSRQAAIRYIPGSTILHTTRSTDAQVPSTIALVLEKLTNRRIVV